MRTVSPGRCGGRGGPDPRPPGAVRAHWPRVLSRRRLPAGSPMTCPPALAPPQLSLARLWPVFVCGGREAGSGPFGVPDLCEPASLALLTLRPSRRRSHQRPRGGGHRAPLCCVLPVEPALLSSRWSSWFLHTWAQPPMFPGGTAGPPSRPRGRGLGDGPGGCGRQVRGRRGVAPCASAASFRGAGTSLTHPAGRNVLTHFLPGDVLSVNGAFADGGFHMTQRSPANLM